MKVNSVGKLIGGLLLTIRRGEGFQIAGVTILCEQRVSFGHNPKLALRIIADRDTYPIKRLNREQVEILIQDAQDKQ